MANYPNANFNGNQANNTGYSIFKPSTDGCVLFNEDRMLRIAYYDSTMKIEIRVKNGEGKYPRPANPADEISVVLQATQIASICRSFTTFIEKLEQMESDLRNGSASTDTCYTFAIPIGSTVGTSKVLEFSTGVPTAEGLRPEITIHMNINENRMPAASYTFRTQSGKVMINYNGGKTPEKTDFIYEYPQFVLIMQIFHNFIEQYGKATLHFSKTKQSEDLVRMVDVIDRIAMQMGVPVKQHVSTGYNYNRGQNATNNLNNVAIQPVQATLSDIVDNPY